MIDILPRRQAGDRDDRAGNIESGKYSRSVKSNRYGLRQFVSAVRASRKAVRASVRFPVAVSKVARASSMAWRFSVVRSAW